MLKPNKLALAVAFAILLPGVSYAEVEISGEAKIEYDMFTSDGQVTGADQPHSAWDALKSEPSLKLFINSDVGEESAIHAELLFADDGEAASKRLEGGEQYSQYEYLRELYIDTSAGNWDLRLGKQQVVWGTADGIKLLDIINPTDYRELNQNVSEDSRIPVWMINAEKDFDSGANIQVLVSEAKANFIAGLDKGGDTGAPFIFKGVDTITGKRNGFLNIANDMGKTSSVFGALLSMGGVTGLVANNGTATAPMSTLTVNAFTSLDLPTFGAMGPTIFGQIKASNYLTKAENQALFNKVFSPMMANILMHGPTKTGNDVLNLAANGREALFSQFTTFLGSITDPTTLGALGKLMLSNLAAGLGMTNVDPNDPAVAGAVANALHIAPPTGPNDPVFGKAIQTAVITQMKNNTFTNGTTNQFSGTLNTAVPMSAFDYMGNTTFSTFDAFVGMKTDYRNLHKDQNNANLGLRYKNSTEGGTNYSLNYAYRYDSNPYVDLHWEDGAGKTLSVKKTTIPAAQSAIHHDVISLKLLNPDGSQFFSRGGTNPATLVFEEKLNRINTLGASFDTAIDGASVPIVIRGEFSYDVGTKQPVIDKNELAIGNLTGALTMKKADMFKYVLGVDVTVATNLLVSTQLIQFYNLNFIDEPGRYTGDFSSLHLTNGLKKGDPVETFISFFLSKPFGDDGQHRWNNILIAENGGGYWDRADVEYSFNDNFVGTAEYNKYWGDENTTFGQFADSSNFQLGLKYIF